MNVGSYRAKRGFTLVELLVVMAIISILAGLLLPALRSVMETAKAIKCTNNLRQVGTMMHMYADRYHGYRPPYNVQNVAGLTFGANTSLEWQEALMREGLSPYPENGAEWVFSCPSYSPRGRRVRNDKTSYAIALEGHPTNNPKFDLKIQREKNSSRKFLVSEAIYDASIPSERHQYYFFRFQHGGNMCLLYTPHRESLNMLFVDSHVAALNGYDILDNGDVNEYVDQSFTVHP